jgi:hypothetical protein
MIKNINDGATSVTITGGADEEFIEIPSTGSSTKLVSTSDTGIPTQLVLSARVGDPLNNVKDKRTLKLTETVLDTEGVARYNTVRLEVSMDPRDTITDITSLLYRAADAASRADLGNFWKFGAIAD